jgi:hypothetical protein
MTQSENRNAGLLAVAAAAMGLIAVVAIVLSGARGGPAGGEPARGIGERDPAGGGSGAPAGSAGPRGGARPDDGAPPIATTRGPDGGLDEGLAEATADLEVVRERRDPADFRPSPEEIAARRAEAERVAATLTPEQRYEAQAFFHDLLVLRVDALRTQIAAARESGDERTLRRLEPALAIVTEELGRSSDRMRTMESELVRSPEAGSAEEEAEDGEAVEGEVESEAVESEAER